MSVPGIVQEALGEEGVAAQVGLGGEDELYVTPTRTLIYRSEGLLSDETVEEYPHEAERVEVSRGRRKAKIVLHHGIEGERAFSLPANRLDDALHPVLAGVLNAAGVTDPGETVKRTFLFSELTLIVTSRRLVKHIGEAVWDVDYEEYPFADATDLTFEEGSVATQLVLEVGGRRERIKAPNDRAPEVRAELEEALFEFHDVTSVEGLRSKTAGEDADDEPADAAADATDDVSFESGLSPLDAVGGDDDGTGTVDVIETGDPEDGTNADAAGQAAGTPETTGAQETGGVEGTGRSQDTGGAQDTASPAGAADATADAGGASDAPADAGGASDPARSTGGGAAREPQDNADEEVPDATEPSEAVPANIDDAALVTDDGVSNDELAERLDELTSAVKRQNELLATHAETIERLIEELKRRE
ncbi:hypothetical protein BRC81_03255 [Halobacteriales archaeon QS_1_68_20]|nr:MAG: hypothetical protein BRC81_03255 [Halobacteriales archaeon QS_1_68_20]